MTMPGDVIYFYGMGAPRDREGAVFLTETDLVMALLVEGEWITDRIPYAHVSDVVEVSREWIVDHGAVVYRVNLGHSRDLVQFPLPMASEGNKAFIEEIRSRAEAARGR